MKRFSVFASCLFLAVAGLIFSEVAAGQAGGDVGRRTIAVTYLKDTVRVTLAGTTQRPNARGSAKVKRNIKRNTTEIDITVENLVPPYNYGADFTTYVLWAITPAGQVSNLGEFRLSGSSARLKTTTPHQAFAMLVSAEPHYLVRLPSKNVVLENLAPTSRRAEIQASEVYFTGDSHKYYSSSSVPELAERDFAKTPPELLQARRALQIARLADAERFCPSDFHAASNSLQHAEQAFVRRAPVQEIGKLARESITQSVRALDIAEERAAAAERRADIARRDEEVRRISETASDLDARLNEVDTRYRASELARKNAEDQLGRALQEAADARSANRQLQSENDRLRADVARLTRELGDIQSENQKLRDQNLQTSQRVEQIERADRERRDTEDRRGRFAELRTAISKITTVKQTDSGFVAILPDNFFVQNGTGLSTRVKAKMDELGQTLVLFPETKFVIEGHSDSRAAADTFAMGRAQSVAQYIAAYHVPGDNFRIESRGASSPAATNRTAAGRASNRRVEIIFTAP